MAKIGYARVSSIGQSLEVQRSKLKDCGKLFEEKRSGVDGSREKLRECLDYVREGDTLVVTRLDRLARSTLHLCRIAELLQKKGVTLVVKDQHIDTETSTGRLLFNMLGAIGQFETEIRAERQLDGINKARENGVQFGRRSKMNKEEIKELKEKRKTMMIKELMKEYGLSKSSVYKYLSRA